MNKRKTSPAFFSRNAKRSKHQSSLDSFLSCNVSKSRTNTKTYKEDAIKTSSKIVNLSSEEETEEPNESIIRDAKQSAVLNLKEEDEEISFSPIEDNTGNCVSPEVSFEGSPEKKRVARAQTKNRSLSVSKPKQYKISKDVTSIENGYKKCPYFKRIPNTSFVVDAFSYGAIPKVNGYFLSHFHYDHYMGLGKHFPGKIYCNEVTAKLCELKLNVSRSKLKVLPMDEALFVDGVEVTVLDANHCPGSSMFIFKVSDPEIYVHTADFRASRQEDNEMWSKLEPFRSKITKLFLDTTYLNPTYCFPDQDAVIGKVETLVLSIVEKFGKDNVLFVFGSYTIGKERLFLRMAKVLDSKIYVDKPKFDILTCFGWPEVTKYVELKSKTATIVVKQMQEIKVDNLRHLCAKMTGSRRFSHVVGFIPTGWSQSSGFSLENDLKPTTVQGNVSIYSVPYSEHSSFEELRNFVQFVKPKEVVTTVGRNIQEMQSYIKQWLKTDLH